MSTAIIVGKFQQAELSDVQMHHIGSLLNKNKVMMMLLLEFPAIHSRRHPLNFKQRKRMIKKHFPSIIIEKVAFNNEQDGTTHQIDYLARHHATDNNIQVLLEDESISVFYNGDLPTKVDSKLHCEVESKPVVSQNELFREGIIHATSHQYPVIYPTVDIAVLRNNNTELLMGRKAGQTGWRFPGGFVDGTDDSFEEAAVRELQEECGPIHVSELSYIGNFKVSDWRYIHESEKIFTTLYACQYVSGESEARDDLEEVKWLEITKLHQKDDHLIVEEHKVLFERLLIEIDFSEI